MAQLTSRLSQDSDTVKDTIINPVKELTAFSKILRELQSKAKKQDIEIISVAINSNCLPEAVLDVNGIKIFYK